MASLLFFLFFTGISVLHFMNVLCVGLEIEPLGLVTDGEHTVLRSLLATKPSSSISKPSYVYSEGHISLLEVA